MDNAQYQNLIFEELLGLKLDISKTISQNTKVNKG